MSISNEGAGECEHSIFQYSHKLEHYGDDSTNISLALVARWEFFWRYGQSGAPPPPTPRKEEIKKKKIAT